MDISYRDELATIHYDLYKDVNGIRPRWYNYKEMTVEDLQKELARLDKQMEQVLEERKKEEKEAEEKFKQTLKKYIEFGAKDEQTALEWIVQKENLRDIQDVEHMIYNLGLLFTPYGKELQKKIMDIKGF